ncbi:hypothetical protein [Aquimarina sp. SS2-1]|uniref:hypothetical protein n=1 Tax=Aquimarina besae TaxID=3342247 RepID=UPI003671F9E7
MALDFHRLDNNEYLFGLDDTKYAHLEQLLIMFQQKTGINVDAYSDTILSIDHQKVILKLIDIWISDTDLNQDKPKIVTIIWFKTWLDHFSNKGIDLKLLGD